MVTSSAALAEVLESGRGLEGPRMDQAGLSCICFGPVLIANEDNRSTRAKARRSGARGRRGPLVL